MKRLALLMLLFAAPVHAATATFTFESGPDTVIYASEAGAGSGYYPVAVSDSGITATFGQGFSYARSLDSLRSGIDYGCTIFGINGLDIGDPSGAVGQAVGLFRNAPSGSWAVRVAKDWGSYDNSITFNTPIKYFGCWIAAVAWENAWSCGSPYVIRFECADDGLYNTHAQCKDGWVGVSRWMDTIDWFSGPCSISMVNGFGTPVSATHPMPYNAYEGCDAEYPNGPPYHWSTVPAAPLCHWQWVEMSSPIAVTKVKFNVYGEWQTSPFFVDNIRVSTDQFPNGVVTGPPDQTHSTWAGALILTGCATDSMPSVSYSCTLRDANDRPVPNARVMFDLRNSQLCWFDQKLGPPADIGTYEVGVPVDGWLASYTNADGYAEFHITGKYNPDTLVSTAKADFYVNEWLWGHKPIVVMDLDNSHEAGPNQMITGNDWAKFLDIYYAPGTYKSKIDADGDGTISGNDVSVWLEHFFGDEVGGPYNANTYCWGATPNFVVGTPGESGRAIRSSAGGSVTLTGVPKLVRESAAKPKSETASSHMPAAPGWVRADGYYDIAGRRLERPPARGVYWEVRKGQPKKIVVVR